MDPREGKNAMDEQIIRGNSEPDWRRVTAEKMAWLFANVPVENPRSIQEILAAGEDIDEQFAHTADRLLAGPMDDEEWRKVERILNAKTVEEVLDDPDEAN
jgi:hypothetical protein